jgi:hypothetical protein
VRSDQRWGRYLDLCITDELCIDSVCALIVRVNALRQPSQLERVWLLLVLCCEAHVGIVFIVISLLRVSVCFVAPAFG